jgi:hypothetical protein
MVNTTNVRDGASMLAALRAECAGRGFSRDWRDYLLPWFKIATTELDEGSKHYRSDASSGDLLA